MKFQNFDVVPSIATAMNFTIVDGDGVKTNLNTASFKLDVTDTSGKSKFGITSTTSVGLGSVQVTIPATITATFKEDLYNYRLFVTRNGVTTLEYEGFLASRPPIYSSTVTPADSGTVLPDGSIYATSEIQITEGTWYAIATFGRFMVTGASTFVLDGRDLRGTIYHNIFVYVEGGPSTRQWDPEMTGMNAFRINVVSGNPTIKYLP